MVELLNNIDTTIILYAVYLHNHIKDRLLVDALDQEGIAYKIIRIDSEYGIYSDKAAMSIGQGYHYGVQIGDIVYDNMTPNGIKLNVWLEDLGLTQEFDSISWKYTNKIVNN